MFYLIQVLHGVMISSCVCACVWGCVHVNMYACEYGERDRGPYVVLFSPLVQVIFYMYCSYAGLYSAYSCFLLMNLTNN